MSQFEQLPQSPRLLPRVEEITGYAPRDRNSNLTLEDLKIELVRNPLAEVRVIPDPIVSMVRVSVVVPTLNEADNLPHVFEGMPTEVFEIILVDGNSTDCTAETAAQLWQSLIGIPQTGKGNGNDRPVGSGPPRAMSS